MGDGLFVLLSTIRALGSINKAAQELNMSYRAAWNKLNKAEKRLGFQIVTRKSGGLDGGGSALTVKGAELAEKFSQLKKRAAEEMELIFQEVYEKGIKS